MSTNNNRLGKEVRPLWKDAESQSCSIKKLSSEKLQRMISNNVEDITALNLNQRGIEKIDDLERIPLLLRLDLSQNKLKRLNNMNSLRGLGMLNVSSNELVGNESLLDVRYLVNLRTLNIGDNPLVREISPDTLRPLVNLQAMIAHNCGLTTGTLIFGCPHLNTLILSKNNISALPELHSSNLPRLVKLSVGYNKLTSVPDLSVCPLLEELRLNNNLITEIRRPILKNNAIKTLDISGNQINSWRSIEVLTELPNLTNLSAKNNPFPEPPPEKDGFVLREDISANSVDSEEHLRYRRHILGLFQIRVGKEQKLKVRLIVLDMKRVKAKWSHRVIEPLESNTKQTSDVKLKRNNGEHSNDNNRLAKKQKLVVGEVVGETFGLDDRLGSSHHQDYFDRKNSIPSTIIEKEKRSSHTKKRNIRTNSEVVSKSSENFSLVTDSDTIPSNSVKHDSMSETLEDAELGNAKTLSLKSSCSQLSTEFQNIDKKNNFSIIAETRNEMAPSNSAKNDSGIVSVTRREQNSEKSSSRKAKDRPSLTVNNGRCTNSSEQRTLNDVLFGHSEAKIDYNGWT